jgi:uncharacterized protein YprB with RNaseH-like and TPR domain
MESLSDKLKSMGVQVGTNNLPASKPRTKSYPIDEVVQGQEVTNPFGNSFLVRSDYPIDYSQGSVILSANHNLSIIGQWGKSNILDQIDPYSIVFLDTETSGLAGGTGTFAFLIGLGFRTEQGFSVVQLFMRDPGQEPALLAELTRIIDPFEAVVTFNGKSFDIPLLNTRHVLNSISTPFQSIDHIDLLPLARRLWRNRLPSRALGDLETYILNVGRTQDEVPGWLVPQIYFDYLRTGDARPLAGVFYHNAMDILSLAALFNYVAVLLNNPLEITDLDSLDIVAIARLYEELGHIENAIIFYELGLQQGLPREHFLQTLQRFALLYRRRGEWESAIQLWQKAAEYEQIDACIELAKYYEHHQRDYLQASYWVQIALTTLENVRLTSSERKHVLHELEHRKYRLVKKQDPSIGQNGAQNQT